MLSTIRLLLQNRFERTEYTVRTIRKADKWRTVTYSVRDKEIWSILAQIEPDKFSFQYLFHNVAHCLRLELKFIVAFAFFSAISFRFMCGVCIRAAMWVYFGGFKHTKWLFEFIHEIYRIMSKIDHIHSHTDTFTCSIAKNLYQCPTTHTSIEPTLHTRRKSILCESYSLHKLFNFVWNL